MNLLKIPARIAMAVNVKAKALWSMVIVSYVIAKARITKKQLIIIFGTPEHSNIGDLAIEWAEREFISKVLKEYDFVSIPVKVMDRHFNYVSSLIRSEDVLMGHGGGNMGDTYPMEEEFRRRVISRFHENKIITFPQTVYFSADNFGTDELLKTKEVYKKHPLMSLIARESVSLEFMTEHFPNNQVILTPDIVLSSEAYGRDVIRSGALACLRADEESVLSGGDHMKIIDFLSRHYDKVKKTDTVSYSKFFPFMIKRRVLFNKLNEFKSSEFVVTDRLHGMVFAAITGTPCIALTNFNHKVLGTYQWIKDLGYIRFCNDVKDIESIYNKMDTKPGNYDPRKFGKYWEDIARLVLDSSATQKVKNEK